MNSLNTKEKQDLLEILNTMRVEHLTGFVCCIVFILMFGFVEIQTFLNWEMESIFPAFLLLIFLIMLVSLFVFNFKSYFNIGKAIKNIENNQHKCIDVLIKKIKLDITYRKRKNGPRTKIVKLETFIKNISEESNYEYYDKKYELLTLFDKEELYYDIINCECSKECKLIFVEGFDEPKLFYL